MDIMESGYLLMDYGNVLLLMIIFQHMEVNLSIQGIMEKRFG
jgi:hypothetical protein